MICHRMVSPDSTEVVSHCLPWVPGWGSVNLPPFVYTSPAENSATFNEKGHNIYLVHDCFSFHTGTIAFGAFIIAVIQMIRIILEYVDNKLKGAENRIAKFIIKCLKCCFYCLEKFMKMINKNAFIMVSIDRTCASRIDHYYQ